jgi:hypothetical protein
LNVFAFIGHGVINEKNEAIFLVNSKNEEGIIEIKAINVDQLAKDFAEIKNSMTIIMYVACRNPSTEHYEQLALKKPSQRYDGISIVFYSSEVGLQT